jgi:hypothetical protein
VIVTMEVIVVVILIVIVGLHLYLRVISVGHTDHTERGVNQSRDIFNFLSQKGLS